MRHLRTFETHNNYLDTILDKITKSGMDSLTKSERDFLDAYSKDDETRMDHIEKIEGQRTFKSSDGHFEFKYDYTEDYGDERYHFGVIYVPDLDYPDEHVEGILEGHIWEGNGQIVPEFDREGIDILEFCEGLEYELDSFLQYVVDTLNDEKLTSGI